MSKVAILIVDDDASVRSAVGALLAAAGYVPDTAADGLEALARFEQSRPDLVLGDLTMPGMAGLELLERLKQRDVALPIVIMTAPAEIKTAVAAMRQGIAIDYVTKPLYLDEVLIVIEHALERSRLRAEARDLRSRLRERYSFENIIGSSAKMQRLIKTVAQVAPSAAPVLVSGEPGTGKALVAATIHEHSSRAAGLFVRLHCVALAESLQLEELLGRERGAVSRAGERRDGRFRQPRGGTLFLDEIANLSAVAQAELLHVLQERAFEHTSSPQAVDVRVVVATSHDLGELVLGGRFNEDLYHLLNAIELHLPPLRERASDIPALATHFLRRVAAETHEPVPSISESALRALTSYAWPGNVRELENVIEQAVALCDNEQIETRHLPVGLAVSSRYASPQIPGARLDELERYAILQTMEAVSGSTSRAAEILGISVRKIQYKLHEYSAAASEPSTKARRSAGDVSEN